METKSQFFRDIYIYIYETADRDLLFNRVRHTTTDMTTMGISQRHLILCSSLRTMQTDRSHLTGYAGIFCRVCV